MRYSKQITRLLGGALALLACAACGGQPAAPAAAPAPSPTIAAVAIPPTTAPSDTPVAAQAPSAAPSNTPPPAQPAGTPAPEPSIYLWPASLPAELSPAPQESRVSAENELGDQGLGFYLITLNGPGKKLAIGGGGLREALPLTGESRQLTVAGRAAKLITSGDQRELVFTVARGQLFLYSFGLSEQELLGIAETLQPIDVGSLRELIAPR